MTFAEKLRSLRKQAGISQEQLAEKLGVSRQAVTKWETDAGIPDMENIMAVSALFDISIDELLSNERATKTKQSPEYLFESGHSGSLRRSSAKRKTITASLFC